MPTPAPRADRPTRLSVIARSAAYGLVGLCAALSIGLGACASAPETAEAPAGPALAKVPDSWAAERAKAAQKRLEATEGGRLVWASMEAHGGLERWYARGPLAFRFRYAPVGDKPARDTFQTIDTWRAQARHHVWGDTTKRFGWTGEQAWTEGGKLPVNPRFWALTPYYFVGVPFVFGDDGVKLKREGEIAFEGRTYDLVRATYEAGVGDAPDDFYVVYIDRETKRVGGVRYIVTYKGFFPDGGHSPEKFMAYDGAQTIDGITLPKTFRTFTWDGSAPVELATNSTLSDVSFKPELEASFFDMPSSATVFKGFTGK